jgi:hypothetical protein
LLISVTLLVVRVQFFVRFELFRFDERFSNVHLLGFSSTFPRTGKISEFCFLAFSASDLVSVQLNSFSDSFSAVSEVS